MKKEFNRLVSAVLVLCLTLSLFAPVTASATELEPTTGILLSEQPTATTAAVEEITETEGEPSVTTYEQFIAALKVLEGYAASYSATSGKDAGELLLNFLRTGVDRYNDGNWLTLAGPEITAFTEYVAAQDAANGTNAMSLKNIEEFTIPNGQGVDFGHMFGTMNISYINSSVATDDLSGWAGDVCDLMYHCKEYALVPDGTVDEMAAYILANCFGRNFEDAFGMDDFYGDMDGFYLVAQMQAGKSFSETVESYFTAELSDADRSAFFLNNRFKGVETREDVREALYNAYAANVGVQVLEADRGLTDCTDLRMASCYALADYMFDQAGDRLGGGEDPTDPTEESSVPTDPSQETTAPTDPSQETTAPTEPENPYYSVFSSSESTLAPGITQKIEYAYTVDNKQIVYYLATVDVTREDVTIMANYKDNAPGAGWGMQRVLDQANAIQASHSDPNSEKYIENFQVVVATNGDGYNMSTGKPGGLLVMEGVEWHPVDGDGFFAILKDGTAMIGTKAEYETYKDQIQEGIGAFGATLVKDGKMAVNRTETYYTSRASRTAIGITAEGKVVMMVLDGRQEPFSAGGSMEEIAQIMLEAGCVHAVNLDGGGSTTYVSRPEGSEELQVINRPSDGYARSVAASLVAVSTAKSSKEFDHANIASEYDYLTIGTSLQLTAVGVSNTGNSAEIPADASWQVSDSSIGSVTADGLFTAAANGEVEVQLAVNGAVVGSKTLNVVVPDSLEVEGGKVNVIFGIPTQIPILAFYNGSQVAFNENDVILGAYEENAGVFEGLLFTGDEEVGIRNVTAVAMVLANEEAYVIFPVNLYKNGEAVFDFDDVTAGNRQLAWDREISNSTTKDNVVYHIDDTSKTMDITYVFALDMKSIEIPPQLADLTYMLPGADTGSTAWDFLLQLAERISVLTEVKIVAQFDPNLDVDISNLTVVNDYFYKKSAVLDENNTLTLVCGWYDQTAAIDPATANPICILSGIKATPKDDASWDANDQLPITNTGEVSYKIYLRASSLYSFANQPANQEKYGLHPYRSQEILYNGGPESGAYFGTSYAQFEDEFTLDKTNRNGWYVNDSLAIYYVDNKPIEAGIHYLPGIEDPANKYYYQIGEDGSVQGTVNGLFELNGALYYAVGGVPQKGWKVVVDASGNANYYFFNTWSYQAMDGVVKIGEYTFTFEDHVLVRGDLIHDSKGVRYMWAGAWVSQEWVEIDGNTYYFDRSEYAVTGLRHQYSPEGVWNYYCFDENGVWLKDYTGFYDYEGITYWIENGYVNEYPGIIVVDGYFYYFEYGGRMIKNCAYWPTKTNGYFETTRRYNFDEQGRMTDPPVPVPEDGKPTAPTTEPTTAPTTEPTTAPTTEPTTAPTTEPTTAPTTEPTTAPTTAPTAPSTEPTQPGEKKNGIVAEDGSLYYYVDGVRTYAGIIAIDGYFYYVRTSGELAHSCKYWPTKTNGFFTTTKQYTFDEQGRMVDPPVTPPGAPEPPTESTTEPTTEPTTAPTTEPTTAPTTEPTTAPTEPVKNGIVVENDGLYYYVDGKLTYGGVLYIDGYYYYAKTSGELVTGRSYWVTKTNGLIPEGSYFFDAQGRVLNPPAVEPDVPEETEPVKNGIYAENDSLYYYKDGKLNYAGLILIDGDYYYVRTNGELAHDCQYWPTKTNDLIEVTRRYTFDSEGKMVDPPTDEEIEPTLPTEPSTQPTEPSAPEEVKNGIVAEDGSLFYYVDGKRNYAGLIVVDGYFYYVRTSGELAHDCDYWPTKTNGLMTTTRRYTFDSEGRMVDPPAGLA